MKREWICRVGAAAIAIFASSTTANAGGWRAVGPYGGSIQLFEHCAGKPSVVYAVTQLGGIFRSTNRGLTWTPASGGLPLRDFRALAVDPSNADSAWLALANVDVLFHTRDGGKHWAEVPVPDGDSGILTVAVSPGDGSVVFFGNANGLYRSRDGGQSWQHITQGLAADLAVFSIAPDLRNPRLVFALGPGFFVSRDGGTSWQGAASPFGADEIRADPHRSGVVVASAFSDIYRTSDAGRHWRKINPISQLGSPISVSFGAGAPSDVLVTFPAIRPTVYKVSGATGRATLYLLDADTEDPTAIDGDPDHDGAILVGRKSGVRRTSDGGRTWSTSVDGMSGVPVRSVTVLGHATFVSENLRTVDGGAHWQSFLPGEWVGVAAYSASSKTLYVATSRTRTGGPIAVKRSLDLGTTWQTLADNIDSGSPTALAVDRLHPETLYLTFDTSDPSLLYRSVDAGVTWKFVAYTSAVTDIETTSDPHCIFVAVGGSIEKSCDDGKSWQDVVGGFSLVDVAIAPSDPKWVYAVDGNHDLGGPLVWRSSDGGVTFEPLAVPDGVGGTASIAVDPRAPDVVYLGVAHFNSERDGGLWRKRGVAPWEDLTPGLFNRSVRMLRIEGGASRRLVAATGAGVQILQLEAQP